MQNAGRQESAQAPVPVRRLNVSSSCPEGSKGQGAWEGGVGQCEVACGGGRRPAWRPPWEMVGAWRAGKRYAAIQGAMSQGPQQAP